MFKLALLSICNQFTVAAFSPYLQILLRNKGYSYSMVGILVALSQFASCIGPMIISTFSGKAGRTKPFLLMAALVSMVLSIPLMADVPLWAVMVLTFLMNFFYWSLNPLSDGFISRGLDGESSRYGLIRALGTMGYVVALTMFSLIGWPVETDNSSIRLSIAGSLCLLVIAILLVGEKRPEAARTEEKETKEFFSFSWFPKSFYIYIGIAALTRVAQVIPDRFISSYMTEEMGLGSYFSVLIAFGALIEFLCLIYGGKILKKGKSTPWAFLLISSIGLAARLLMYLVPGLVPFIIAQGLHGLTFGIFHIGCTTFISEKVEPDHYDMAMSIYWGLATNFPQMIGALIGGYIVEGMGYPMLFASYSIFPFAAIILTLLFRKSLIEKKN